MTNKTIKIVVAISGTGRSLENMISRENSNKCLYQVVGVISSSGSCKGVEIAKHYKLPLYIDTFKSSLEIEEIEKLREWLNNSKADYIVLAGFLKKFPLLNPWKNDRIINIHPALLPSFGGKGMYGAKVHQAVSKSGVTTTGATVHFVNEKYDEGQIISQVKIEITPHLDFESIGKKVFEKECQLLPETLNLLAEKKLPLEDRSVYQIKS